MMRKKKVIGRLSTALVGLTMIGCLVMATMTKKQETGRRVNKDGIPCYTLDDIPSEYTLEWTDADIPSLYEVECE